MIAAGHVREIDVAEVNGRVFVNNSSVGLYPDMVRLREVEQERLGRSKRMAMLSASLTALRHFRRHRLWISARGAGGAGPDAVAVRRQQPLPGEPARARPARGARRGRALPLRDPRAQPGCTCSGPASAASSAARPAARLRHRLCRARPRSPRTATLLTVSADGETVRMETPLNYRIRPKALRLIVPAP